MALTIDRLDHLVLTVRDIDASIDFYTRVMGFEVVNFGQGRKALAFGRQKINLHAADAPLAPHALVPTPGSADLCFVSAAPIDTVLAQLAAAEVPIESGPVPRTGAIGPITSVYFRDPDRNLIEVSVY